MKKTKKNTAKAADPNSKRSMRKLNSGRSGQPSRCNRRSEYRLQSTVNGYKIGAAQNAPAFTSPGAQNKW